MIYKTVDLYKYFKLPRKGADGGQLQVYVPEENAEMGKKLRPALLSIAGGGYDFVSGREGEPVAVRFLSFGYAAFSLRYTCKTAFPVPLIEAGMAMAYIRENAKKLCVDPACVAAVGFSAGGHLTGMLATLFDDEALDVLGKRKELVRPDAVILSYPVLTTGKYSHNGTAENICGGDKALRERLSLEKRVTKNSSPAFLWHTGEDDCVPVENSLAMANAYRKCGVPFELHVFEKGWHGLSVISKETYNELPAESVLRNACWVELASSWLKARGFGVREV